MRAIFISFAIKYFKYKCLLAYYIFAICEQNMSFEINLINNFRDPQWSHVNGDIFSILPSWPARVDL